MPAVIALLIIVAIALGTPSVRIETNLSKSQLSKIQKIYIQFSGHPKYDYMIKQHFDSKNLIFVDNKKQADASITFALYSTKHRYISYEPIQSSGQITNYRHQYRYQATTYVPTERSIGLLRAELIIQTENFGYWIAKASQGTIFAKWETILEKILERCPLSSRRQTIGEFLIEQYKMEQKEKPNESPTKKVPHDEAE